jgi:hypothetical protein
MFDTKGYETFMAQFFLATKEQRSVITDIVQRDASGFFSAANLTKTVEGIASCIELMVHDDVVGPIHQSIAHGLPQSPHQVSSDGSVVYLSGAREVGMDLATRLVAVLEVDHNKVLYIPHAYANPVEINSLQGEFNKNVLELAGKVYIRCSGPNIASELIRRALASMICGYSVGWLLDGDLPAGNPCMAVVPIFDGEGWAVLGKSVFPHN